MLREKQEELAAALKVAYDSFYPNGALDSMGRIVSDTHHKRLQGLLARTQGEIVFGGRFDEKRGFEPTVVKNVSEGDSLMEECEHSILATSLYISYMRTSREIFGPILPLLPVDSVEDAIEFITSR